MNGRANEAGDLGRRVARRRRDLGLTVGEAAEEAGMAAGYLDYLEHNAANVTKETLCRLAQALATTPDTLLGRPPERQIPEGGRGMEQLSAGECVRLLSGGGVGRVVLSTEHGPAAFPVNYAILGGGIVFRTAEGTQSAEAVGGHIGFEADQLDERNHTGWSVQVSGSARRITEPATTWLLHDLIRPWAPGRREVYVRIDPRRITGHRITG